MDGVEVKKSVGHKMDPNKSQYYWLSWKGGVIEFGMGSIVRNSRWIYWQPSAQELIKVNALSVSTETTCHGQWTFDVLSGID